jgi:hypothetical protein
MITVRDATAEDYPAIQAIHREMGMEYELGAIESPLFLVRKVAVDDAGNVVGACLLRAALETMLLLLPKLNAREKMTAMISMQPEVLADAWSLGLDSVEARIPIEVERRFQKRLCRLGWSRNRDGWHPWSRSTHA